ncbi:MAG: DNA mismatch repair protein MutS [Clostridia bacterium]|nr:DNA mismatch repair protein MutS [Clostridia bacterium]
MAKSPMMLQYLAIKEKYPDAVVMWRLGDFFEMFFEDAKTASRVLELTLTGRDCGEEERAPMCGVPYHAVDNYITRLVSKGYKVVICDQMEDPASAKGIVARDVVRIVTPGTLTGANLPSETKNNYLSAIYISSGEVGVAFCDISTGDLYVTGLSGDNCIETLQNELGTYSPSEVILNIRRYDILPLSVFLDERLGAFVSDMQDKRFEKEKALKLIAKTFSPSDAKELCSDYHMACAVGALIDYIHETQKTDISYIKSLKIYSKGEFLEMDISTRRNLELVETMREKEKKGSLLGVLDETKTSMGARLLRKWVETPLVNVNAIEQRLCAVEELASDLMLRSELEIQLRSVLDLERLMSKLVYGSAVARDLRAIAATLEVVPKIRELLSASHSYALQKIYNETDELSDIRNLICSSITQEPPFSVREGGFIKKGYNAEVDRLSDILTGGKDFIREIEEREREKTGIPKLKVGYNRVFGYYIEISKLYADRVPEDYIRKQTLVNGERYITDELKDLEATILGAADRRNALEYQLFTEICAEIGSENNVKRLQNTASTLAMLDVYLSLALVACENNYVRPEVDVSDIVDIREGRHPVVESFTGDGAFVPNDVHLDTGMNRMLLITGPNMAGKSTYMRQTALICIMAQLGSFVPASSARIGVCDKIFTRVGASDDLASGKSTFMLEMNEVAYILKNATKRSLIIYDEIGRGTSTYDGMSIAKAVVEYTAGKRLGAKTMFATHYHELTDLEGQIPGVVNYNIAAKKKGDSVIFLRKIVRGHADDSYGIEVASLAGVPNEVIRRAKQILQEIEKEALTPIKKENKEKDEITFEDLAKDEVIRKIKNTDPNILTPIEALTLLSQLHGML